MKIYLYLLIYLSTACASYSQIGFRSPSFLASINAVALPPAANFFQEFFEGTGYERGAGAPNGWVELGGAVIDEDYLISPLEGAQSLQMFHAFNQLTCTNILSPAQSVVYFKLRFKIVDEAGGVYFFRICDSANQNLARIQWTSADKVELTVQGGTPQLGSTTLSNGTLYYMWGWADQNAGDALLYVSSSNSKPGSTECPPVTDGDGAALGDACTVVFSTNGGGANIIVDALEISTTGYPTP